MCVNAQRTLVREDSNAKIKAKDRKPSTAESPFHIPFFMKGGKNSDQ
jgi:hypothetical protein